MQLHPPLHMVAGEAHPRVPQADRPIEKGAALVLLAHEEPRPAPYHPSEGLGAQAAAPERARRAQGGRCARHDCGGAAG